MTVRYLGLAQLEISAIKIGKRYRTNPDDGVEELAESVQDLGLINPVIVKRSSMKLLAGERRVRAHLHLKLDKISAILVETDNELEDLRIERDENVVRKEFLWKDQALLEYDLFERQRAADETGKWTTRKQSELRKELGEPASHTEISKRVQLGEALRTLPDLADCVTEDEAWKKLKKLEEEGALRSARSKLSPELKNAPQWAEDHYIVGNALTALEVIAPESVDFVEVDPPYAVDLVTRKNSRNQEKAEAYTEWSVEAYERDMQVVAAHCYRVMKKNTFGIFWYGTRHHCITYQVLIGAGFAVNPVNAIWYKGQSGQADQPDVAFSSCYEPFFLVRKGKPKFNVPGRSNVFHFAPLAPSTKRHPTQKPLALMEDILNTICRPGNRIMVPFLGSGVTLIAAYKLQMTGFGWDLGEKNRESFLNDVRKEFSK